MYPGPSTRSAHSGFRRGAQTPRRRLKFESLSLRQKFAFQPTPARCNKRKERSTLKFEQKGWASHPTRREIGRGKPAVGILEPRLASKSRTRTWATPLHKQNQTCFPAAACFFRNYRLRQRAKIISRHAGVNEMRKHRGFSLIELLIVVAIILVIAAIAVPNLLRARIAANESSAVQSVRTINTAQVTYRSQFPNIGFAGTLSALGPSASTGCGTATPTSGNACLLDWVLSNAKTTPKSGYYFTDPAITAAGGINVDYEEEGTPAAKGQTGSRAFCSNSDGVIRFNATGAAIGQANCASQTALQ